MGSERAPTVNSDPLINQIIHFRGVILGEEVPLVSGAEGTKSLEVIDAIQRAAVTHQLVQLDGGHESTEIEAELPLTEVINGSE